MPSRLPQSSHVLNKRESRAVSEARRAILGRIKNGRRDCLTHAAQVLRRLLRAYNCAIFLVAPDDRSFLVLEASANERWKQGREVRIRLNQKIGLSLTSDLAGARIPLRLNAEELKQRKFHSRGTEYLARTKGRGRRHSLVAVRLFSRDGILIGFIKCENKLTRHGRTAHSESFTDPDRTMLEQLAEDVLDAEHAAVAWTATRVLELTSDLGQQMAHYESNRARLRERLLGGIIRQAVALFGADRGDFIWWTADGGDLVYAAHAGPLENKKMSVGCRVPQRAFVRKVFEKPDPQGDWIFDISNREVRKHADYAQAHSKTRSELAVPVELNGIIVGVLNIESFEAGWFDRRDVPLLKTLAKHAAVAVHRVQTEGIVQKAIEHDLMVRENPDNILQPVLHVLLECTGFDEGILYRVSRDRKALRIAAWRDVKMTEAKFKKVKAANELDHSLEAGHASFARKVYESRTVCKSKPDPSDDPEVNQTTLKHWEIPSQLIGYPLRFAGEAYGCLVLWARFRISSRSCDISPSRFEDLAHLAATKLAFWEAQEKQAEDRQRYQDLADHSPMMVFTKIAQDWTPGEKKPTWAQTKKFVFDYASKNYLDYVLGKKHGKLTGKTDANFYPEEDARKYYEDDWQIYTTGKRSDSAESNWTERNVRPRDGQERKVRVWKTQLKDSRRRVVGIQVVFWDRTEFQDKEEQERQIAAQDEIRVNDIRHRVSSTLTGINTSLAVEEVRWVNTEFAPLLRRLRLSVQGQQFLLDQLYTRGRDDSGVDMRAYLRRLTANAVDVPHGRARKLSNHDIVTAFFPERLAKVCAMIVTELIANSLEHGFRGLPDDTGTVTVKLQKSKNGYQLTVGDDGVGYIDSEVLPNAGRGRGIEIVRRWAASLGASLTRLQTPSETPSGREGTWWVLSVPEAPHLIVTDSASNRRLVIVEDDPDQSLSLQDLLRGKKYEVVAVATNREEAVEVCNKLPIPPDVILMDIRLGHESLGGIEAAKQIRFRFSGPIIFLTLHELEDEHRKRLNAIPNSYFVVKEGFFDRALLYYLERSMELRLTGQNIFVCYSHEPEDVECKKSLLKHLRNLQENNGIDIKEWDDEKVPAGAAWWAAIDEAMAACSVAIILISVHSMGSKFIQAQELPWLLARAKQRQTRLFFIRVSECRLDYGGGDSLIHEQFFEDTFNKPMLTRPHTEWHGIWTRLCDAIIAHHKELRRQQGIISKVV